MRRSVRILAALLAVAAPRAAAQRDTPSRTPEGYLAAARALGDSTIVRGAAGARLDDFLTRAGAFGMSGVVLVADSTGVLVEKGYGLASRTPRRALDPADVFDIGSITKGLTGAAIVLLEAEGRLSTSDPLSKYFPEVPADKAGITLHQLLTHSSGIVGDVAGDYDPVPRDSAVHLAFRAPLVSRPGAEFSYSNVGFSILSAVIEKVSGEPWEAFMRRRIFQPAGMVFTGYRNPRWDRSRIVHTFSPPVEFGSALDRLEASGGPWWNLLGNGGLLSTAGDLYRFDRALYRGEVVPFGAQGRLFSPHLRRSETTWIGYDWWTEWTDLNEMAVHHGSDSPDYGFNGEFRRYPAERSVIILLANTRHNGNSIRRYLMSQLRRAMLDSVQPLPPPVHPAAPAELAAFRGRFAIDSASHFVVDTVDGHLAVLADGQPAVDALTFQRAASSIAARARLNAEARRFVDALARGDSAVVDSTMGDAAAARALRQGWRAAVAQHGALTAVEVLGTSRLDRGQFVTTMRLRMGTRPVTVRFAWAGGHPEISSDDGALPRFAGFFPVSPIDAALYSGYWWIDGDGLVTWDLATSQALRASVRRGANGRVDALIIHVPGGDVVATSLADTRGARRRPGRD